MDVWKLIFWILIVYGINQIVTESTLFAPLRNSKNLPKFVSKIVNCFLCNSVWTGFLVSYLVWSPSLSVFLHDYIYSGAIPGLFYKLSKAFPDYIDLWQYMWSKWITICCSFLDGMFACTVLWFLHIFELKITSFLPNKK